MADFKEFPNSGSMHLRDKRSEKAPDFGGDFTIENEVLDWVVNQARQGLPVKLEVSAWKRLGGNNKSFMSLSINTPYEVRGGQRNTGQPQRRGQTGYNNGNAGGGFQRNQQADFNRGNGSGGGDFRRSSNQRPLDNLNDPRMNGDEFLGRQGAGRDKDPWDM